MIIGLQVLILILAVVDVLGAGLLYMEYYARKMEELEDEVPAKGRRLKLLTAHGHGPVAVPTQIYQIDHM
jgi:Tfp pilus assembly protein PilO